MHAYVSGGERRERVTSLGLATMGRCPMAEGKGKRTESQEAWIPVWIWNIKSCEASVNIQQLKLEFLGLKMGIVILPEHSWGSSVIKHVETMKLDILSTSTLSCESPRSCCVPRRELSDTQGICSYHQLACDLSNGEVVTSQ